MNFDVCVNTAVRRIGAVKGNYPTAMVADTSVFQADKVWRTLVQRWLLAADQTRPCYDHHHFAIQPLRKALRYLVHSTG